MKVLQSIDQLYAIFLQYPSIQTDTRKLKSGDIFFALKGPNFNGNQYAKKALEMGAAYAIVDQEIEGDESNILLCNDSLTTLQELALHHRKQFSIPFIAITGSNGKTTTKELVSTVLASKYVTYTTVGNLNNHIGVPLTILSIKQDAEYAVIEMGANHQKEIQSYCAYTLPTHGIITNCGKAHLEGFGGVEGVKKGKGELYDFLYENNGTVFLCSDFDYLVQMASKIQNKITYGTTQATYQGKISYNQQFLEVQITNQQQPVEIKTNLVGDYNFSNILTAYAIGKHFGIEDETIKKAIENYFPSNSRSQLVQWETNTVIVDAYNANPTSMKAAIENFVNQNYSTKVLLLGAMMELGEDSLAEHQQLIQLIQQYNWQDVVLVGGDFKHVNHQFTFFNTAIEVANWLNEKKYSNTAILLKGSRSTKMEQALPIAIN